MPRIGPLVRGIRLCCDEGVRILICGLNYAPELVGAGKFTGELGAWLVSRGHQVRVVTAHPYYPFWRVQPGYSAWKYTRESNAGVDVLRCPLYVPGRPTTVGRVLHLLSFVVSSAPAVLFSALQFKPDVIRVSAPTILCGVNGWLAARISRAKAWFHILDFEADAAFELGMLRLGLLRRTLSFLESFLLRRFDRVSSLSPKMVERLVEKGVPPESAFLFPDWVDLEKIHPLAGPSPLRAALEIGKDTRVALCAGNMGEKQGLDTLLESARLLAGRKDILFVLSGDGVARSRIQHAARELSNVRFLPIQPQERLNELLNLADVHLLPQKSGVGDSVMPSRLGGMLASGRPVVAMAEPGTQVAEIVPGRGVVVGPANPKAFASAIAWLMDDSEERRRLGAAARAYAEGHLGSGMILVTLEEALNRLQRSA